MVFLSWGALGSKCLDHPPPLGAQAGKDLTGFCEWKSRVAWLQEQNSQVSGSISEILVALPSADAVGWLEFLMVTRWGPAAASAFSQPAGGGGLPVLTSQRKLPEAAVTAP